MFNLYNLLVSHQFRDWDGGAFRFEKSRFLEYTADVIKQQLCLLSREAIESICTWPCILMEEGRGKELVRIARISELHDRGSEIRLNFELCPSEALIINDDVWRLREELDIEQFEFSRYHWAVKERDLFSILRDAGHKLTPPDPTLFEGRTLPAPKRPLLIKARDSISEWSHTDIDDLLLEMGVPNLSADRKLGSPRDRANAILQFTIKNPSVVTAENSLLSTYLVRRSSATNQGAEKAVPATLTQEEELSTEPIPEPDAEDRSPNRVFVVHGQNQTVRTEVVEFLQSLGLVGIVLHNQPNMGRHLLTKFIDEAELVTFAVILMTDDDLGSLKGGEMRPRARQNVILELGYFLAYLGQEKVCALITPGLETPSDFDGIAYIRMDDQQRWKQELKRELLAAQLPVVESPTKASAN
jgi:predicted nucleotide-binding protein